VDFIVPSIGEISKQKKTSWKNYMHVLHITFILCVPLYTINIKSKITVNSQTKYIVSVYCSLEEFFLIIKPTRCTNFSSLLDGNSACFGQFLCPTLGVFHCTHSNGICHTGLLTACEQEHMLLLASWQQTCMTYSIAVCTVKNSWCWTEELSETCRVLLQD
jgi:hypothetical protein